MLSFLKKKGKGPDDVYFGKFFTSARKVLAKWQGKNEPKMQHTESRRYPKKSTQYIKMVKIANHTRSGGTDEKRGGGGDKARSQDVA